MKISGNMNLNNISGKFVLTLKEVPEVLFTGLKDNIGIPREYERNLKDLVFFDEEVDISIPI